MVGAAGFPFKCFGFDGNLFYTGGLVITSERIRAEGGVESQLKLATLYFNL